MHYQCDKFQPDPTTDRCLYHYDYTDQDIVGFCKLWHKFRCEGVIMEQSQLDLRAKIYNNLDAEEKRELEIQRGKYAQSPLQANVPAPATPSLPPAPDPTGLVAPLRPKAHLSHSQLQDFLRCRRRYYHRHVQRILPQEDQVSAALAMGSLWDVAMQVRFGQGVKEALGGVVERYNMNEFDVARVQGVYKAHKELVDVDEGAQCQVQVTKVLGGVQVTGIYDRVYDDHFVETKFSSQPSNYTGIFRLQAQLGVYFLLNPDMKYCVIEVVQVPQLRQLKGSKSKPEESAEEYRDRIYRDVIARPAYYFPHYKRTTRSFGECYYRKEFNLDEVLSRLQRVQKEIDRALYDGEEAFYIEEPGCFAYNQWCEYLDICKTGCISQIKYKVETPAEGHQQGKENTCHED